MRKCAMDDKIGRKSNWGFKIMAGMYAFRDLFPVDKRIGEFGINEGSTVIDYSCGIGSYL